MKVYILSDRQPDGRKDFLGCFEYHEFATAAGWLEYDYCELVIDEVEVAA